MIVSVKGRTGVRCFSPSSPQLLPRVDQTVALSIERYIKDIISLEAHGASKSGDV